MPAKPTSKQTKKFKVEDKILSEQQFTKVDRRIKKDETKLQQFFRRIMRK